MPQVMKTDEWETGKHKASLCPMRTRDEAFVTEVRGLRRRLELQRRHCSRPADGGSPATVHRLSRGRGAPADGVAYCSKAPAAALPRVMCKAAISVLTP